MVLVLALQDDSPLQIPLPAAEFRDSYNGPETVLCRHNCGDRLANARNKSRRRNELPGYNQILTKTDSATYNRAWEDGMVRVVGTTDGIGGMATIMVSKQNQMEGISAPTEGVPSGPISINMPELVSGQNAATSDDIYQYIMLPDDTESIYPSMQHTLKANLHPVVPAQGVALEDVPTATPDVDVTTSILGRLAYGEVDCRNDCGLALIGDKRNTYTTRECKAENHTKESILEFVSCLPQLPLRAHPRLRRWPVDFTV
jgi:hypothetical protein